VHPHPEPTKPTSMSHLPCTAPHTTCHMHPHLATLSPPLLAGLPPASGQDSDKPVASRTPPPAAGLCSLIQRCSLLFLRRFSEGWKNQCSQQHSVGRERCWGEDWWVGCSGQTPGVPGWPRLQLASPPPRTSSEVGMLLPGARAVCLSIFCSDYKSSMCALWKIKLPDSIPRRNRLVQSTVQPASLASLHIECMFYFCKDGTCLTVLSPSNILPCSDPSLALWLHHEPSCCVTMS
jgi:hypothetical protein